MAGRPGRRHGGHLAATWTATGDGRGRASAAGRGGTWRLGLGSYCQNRSSVESMPAEVVAPQRMSSAAARRRTTRPSSLESARVSDDTNASGEPLSPTARRRGTRPDDLVLLFTAERLRSSLRPSPRGGRRAPRRFVGFEEGAVGAPWECRRGRSPSGSSGRKSAQGGRDPSRGGRAAPSTQHRLPGVARRRRRAARHAHAIGNFSARQVPDSASRDSRSRRQVRIRWIHKSFRYTASVAAAVLTGGSAAVVSGSGAGGLCSFYCFCVGVLGHP